MFVVSSKTGLFYSFFVMLDTVTNNRPHFWELLQLVFVYIYMYIDIWYRFYKVWIIIWWSLVLLLMRFCIGVPMIRIRGSNACLVFYNGNPCLGKTVLSSGRDLNVSDVDISVCKQMGRWHASRMSPLPTDTLLAANLSTVSHNSGALVSGGQVG